MEIKGVTGMQTRKFSARIASLFLPCMALEPAFFLMERRRLQGIQERAEGQLCAKWSSESEIVLWIAAFIGFLIAAGRLVFRRAWHIPAVLAGLTVLITLFLAFAQPTLWLDVRGVIIIYVGLIWLSFRQKSHILLIQ